MHSESGVTLVELMVSVAIAAITLAVGVPSFVDSFNDNRLIAQADAMMANLNYARSEAVKRGLRVTICRSDSGSSCSNSSQWNQGWIVFMDGGGTPGVVESGETILRKSDGNSHIAINQPANYANYISYLGSGISIGNGNAAGGTMQFCGASAQDRQIVISATGRARMEATSC